MELIGYRYRVRSTASRDGNPGTAGLMDVVTEEMTVVAARNPAAAATGNIVLGLSFEWDIFPSGSPVIKFVEFNYDNRTFSKRPLATIPESTPEVIREVDISWLDRILDRLGLRSIPDNPIEFSALGAEQPPFGFVFFSLEEIRMLGNASETLLVSGASIRPGAIGGLANGENYDPGKAYFTLKLEGDLQMITLQNEETTAANNNNGNTFIIDSIQEDAGTRIAEVGLPLTILGHPCPPIWEIGNAIEMAIIQQLMLRSIIIPATEEGETNWVVRIGDEEPIPLSQYMTEVRKSLFLFNKAILDEKTNNPRDSNIKRKFNKTN